MLIHRHGGENGAKNNGSFDMHQRGALSILETVEVGMAVLLNILQQFVDYNICIHCSLNILSCFVNQVYFRPCGICAFSWN